MRCSRYRSERLEHGRPDTAVRIRLELQSRPESVALVRSVIRTVARAVELDRGLIDDMRTAVSEACNNVVLHAYPAADGPLIFALAVHSDTIEVVVRDHGCGMRPGCMRNRGLGMGVVVINSLADRAEFETDRTGGTEVRMTFRRPAPVAPGRLGDLRLGVWTLAEPEASGGLRVR